MIEHNINSREISKQLSKTVLKDYRPSSIPLKKAVAYIEQNTHFVLTTHIGADADGIGSQVGLYYLLKYLKKEVLILNCERKPHNLTFIIQKIDFLDVQQFKEQPALLVSQLREYFALILDSSAPSRSQAVFDILEQAECQWASIDHHNIPEPSENLCIDHSYVATSEFIWDLYQYFEIPINNHAALALYAGIIADSGNFRYPKTSLRTHLAGGHLLQNNINSDEIYRKLFESRSIDRLSLEHRIFKTVYIQRQLGFVCGKITKDIIKDLSVGDGGTEGIVNHLLGFKNVYISCLAIETDEGELKASLRSIGQYNVANIAQQFGGGGHNNASGLKISKPFSEALKILIDAIEKYLKIQKNNE